MPVNLSVKSVPDGVARALRARAEQNHRSLQGELMAILELAALGQAPEFPAAATHAGTTGVEPARSHPKLSIDEVAARAAKLFPKGTASSVDFIRTMRDGRYGEEWAHNGRHGTPD